MSANSYGGLIWTNHALERLRQRGLPQDLAWQAYKYPDEVREGNSRNSSTYLKRHGKYLITVIVTENERREHIVVSTWIDPPMKGTDDYRKKQKYVAYKKAALWGKVWMTIKQQIGLG